MGVIGKTMGQAFDSNFGLSNKVIKYAKKFENNGESFSAYYAANNYIKGEGFTSGSMEGDNPIAFIYNGSRGIEDDGTSIITTKWDEKRPMVITKWTRLGGDDKQNIDGILISTDWRNDDAYAIFFVFPE